MPHNTRREPIRVSTYGRLPDGTVRAATVWYQPTHDQDPAGVEVPGHKGLWRVTASTPLPDEVEPVTAEQAETEHAELLASFGRQDAESEAAADAQAEADTAQLIRLGLPAQVAARLTGHTEG